MSDKIIQITEMNKWFGDFQVLKNINLEVEKNKKIVVSRVFVVFPRRRLEGVAYVASRLVGLFLKLVT